MVSTASRLGAFASVLLLVAAASVVAIPSAGADPLFPPSGDEMETPPPMATVGEFHALSTTRIRDTRTGVGGAIAALAARATSEVPVLGVGGVPASGVAAVVLSIKAAAPAAAGSLIAYPRGTTRPAIESLNFSAGVTTSNLAVVKVGTQGKVNVFNSSAGATDLVVDVQGWYGSMRVKATGSGNGALLRPVAPTRIRDTRAAIGGPTARLGAQQTLDVTVAGAGGVPASGAVAAVLNVKAALPDASGALTLYPTGAARPTGGSLNFRAARTVSNLAVVKLGTGGKVRVFNGSAGPTDVVVDVLAWYRMGDPSGGGQFSRLAPTRIRDTRSAIGGAAGALGPNQAVGVRVTGVGGVPATGAAAVAVNVTAVSETAAGTLSAYPTGTARGGASTLNYLAQRTISNLAILKVGTGGKVDVYNGSTGTTHLVVDVIGYYTKAGFQPADAGSALASQGVGAADHGVTVFHSKVAHDASKQGGLRPDALGASATLGEQAPSSVTEYDGEPTFPIDEVGYLNSVDPSVGRVYELNAQGGIAGTCTGTVVARNLVLTAGHCVYSGGAFTAGWSFAPRQLGTSKAYGVWTADTAVVLNLYMNTGTSGADWAYLIFNTPNAQGQLIGDVTSYFPIHSDSPGGPKYSIGYPSEGWFGKSNTCTVDDCWPYHCYSRIVDASTQYSKRYNDTSVSYGGWWDFGFGCYMTGGESGGPIFEVIGNQWYVVGVNSHISDAGNPPHYSDNCFRPSGICWEYSYNTWSPYFNQTIIDVWNQYATR